MIYKEIQSGNQMLNTRWSCATSASVIDLPQSKESKDYCLCDYQNECTYYEFAFTDVEDNGNEYKNDYRKFLLNPLSTNSEFSFILIDKNNVEYVIYSNTESDPRYAEIYNQGFNNRQGLQVGIKVIWWKVVFNLGFGEYRIKTIQNDFGNDTINTSHIFKVVPFNSTRANGTIKINVQNQGVTQNGTNWSGLGTFENMIRLKGRLVLIDPEITIESLIDSNQETRPVQSTSTDVYNLKLDRVPFDIGEALIHESVLMNWIVTDYNLFNQDFRNKEMIVESSVVTNTLEYLRKSYELTAKNNISKVNRRFI